MDVLHIEYSLVLSQVNVVQLHHTLTLSPETGSPRWESIRPELAFSTSAVWDTVGSEEEPVYAARTASGQTHSSDVKVRQRTLNFICSHFLYRRI